MASHFLTTTSTLSCPHSGHVTIGTSNTRARAGGEFIARPSDQFTIAGCTFQISGSPHPCVRVQWDVHAEQHKSAGDWSLTENSVGLCLAADGATQGMVEISSTQGRGAGS